jgi:hypothetical protein
LVLDTDMLTLWLHGQEAIAARVATTPPQQLALTIITVEEVLGGWYTKSGRPAMINSSLEHIRRSNKPWSILEAFSSCRSTLQGFAVIVSYGPSIVVSVRMISASQLLFSKSRVYW